MVDSVLDNLTLRTHRRADLRLELGLNTPAAKLELLLAGMRKLLQRKEIEEANVVMTDITAAAVIIQSDYYTAPLTIREFNNIKQEVNLQVLKLLEELDVEIAGASTDIRLGKPE
jgi:MscS family membrane protein